MCLFALGITTTVGCTSASLSVSNANNSFLSSEGSRVGGSSCSRLFCGAAILTKFGTNLRNILHSPREDLGSGSNVGGRSLGWRLLCVTQIPSVFGGLHV